MSRLAMWSGPRNVSTALMRSWQNRRDTVVVDEPLYPHYLAVTGLDHPGRDEVVALGETDWRRVVDRLLAPLPEPVAICYQKHMAHHLTPDVGRSWIALLRNVLLIRDPRHVVASYVRSRAQVEPDDIGLAQQQQLYGELSAAGSPPLVIDSADLLGDPETYLRMLCEHIGVCFDPAMLHWPRGRRDSDGVWAKYWYAAVERSTGFEPYRSRDVHLEGHAAEVAEQCLPLYADLHARRWAP